jgi:hypothetical protein
MKQQRTPRILTVRAAAMIEEHLDPNLESFFSLSVIIQKLCASTTTHSTNVHKSLSPYFNHNILLASMNTLSPRRRRSLISQCLILMLSSMMSWSLLLMSWVPMVQAFSFSPQKIPPRTVRFTPLSMAGIQDRSSDDGYDGLGEYDPSENIRPEREVVVGNPQLRVKEKERSVTSILKELAAIQQQGPQKYCILGTRHCSYLHQQIIELL